MEGHGELALHVRFPPANPSATRADDVHLCRIKLLWARRSGPDDRVRGPDQHPALHAASMRFLPETGADRVRT